MNIQVSKTRPEIIDLIPEKARKVLDIGCGCGDVGFSIKNNCGCEVTGIEFDLKRAEEASLKIDKVIRGDVEVLEPPFTQGYFDCIIFADVLEHLREPLDVLKRFKRYLKSGGSIVVSLPNIRHISIIRDLVFRGKWEYVDFGLMDKGHLRFFTKKSIEEMFAEGELEICSMNRLFSVKGSKYFNAITFGLFKDLLTTQYVCRLEMK